MHALMDEQKQKKRKAAGALGKQHAESFPSIAAVTDTPTQLAHATKHVKGFAGSKDSEAAVVYAQMAW